MGLSEWLARRGNVGGTARAVAQGWKTIKEKYPTMKPREIGETYINIRYQATNEPHLAEEVSNSLPYDVTPLVLSWTIFRVENQDELSTVYDHMETWKRIMSEEIEKYVLKPD